MKDYPLNHWSAKPRLRLNEVCYLQEIGFKPRGLWFDVDYDWQRWCEGADFRLRSLTYRYPIALVSPERILWLRHHNSLDVFTMNYGKPLIPGKRPHINYKELAHLAIDWRRVADRHGGIIIPDYHWTRRHSLIWYYGWDCASGCIWDLSIIKIGAPILMAQKEEAV